MANQNATQDDNLFPALIAHAGTTGTAETIKVVANSAGALTVSERLTTGFNGGTVSVGTAAIELTFTGTPRGILITADHNNGTMVYVGDSNVSQTGSAAIARLDPGESLSIEEFDDTSAALYAVAGTTAQKVYKAAFT